MLKHVTHSLALLAAVAATAVAQNATQTPTQPGQPGQARQGATQPGQPGQARQGATQPGQPGAQAGNLDHEIATCLALGNQEEIALAQMAESQAQHDRVKEFAQMMQRDHTQALQRLQQVAPNVSSINLQGRPGATTQSSTRQQPGSAVQQAGGTAQQQFGQPGGVRPAGSTQPSAGQDSARTELAQAIASQCLALTQRELQEKSGAEFDQCYVAQQVGAHIGMLAKLQASEQYASGELRTVIQELTPKIEGHLQHAKELAKELQNAQASNDAAQRDAAPRR
jgi:predicted outer membrane protein